MLYCKPLKQFETTMLKPFATLFFVLSTLTACSSDFMFRVQDKLSDEFEPSPTRIKLQQLQIDRLTLYCDDVAHVMAAQFEFTQLDGRAPVKAKSTSECPANGIVLQWTGTSISSKKAYPLQFVESEITQLLTAANIQPAVVDWDAEAAAHALHNALAYKLPPKLSVQFTCKNKGDRYRYLAVAGETYARGRLETRCDEAHQNFTVATGRRPAVREKDILVVAYNNAPASAVVPAVSEYLKTQPIYTAIN